MYQKLQEDLITTRRLIHQYSELGWQEKHSTETVEAFLNKFKIPHRRVAKTGVITDLPGDADGPNNALAEFGFLNAALDHFASYPWQALVLITKITPFQD